jgi:hypothetical protein
MPRFEPITTEEQVTRAGELPERSMLDFKAKYDASKHFEMAKDVAAFANHLGGALVIGAAETTAGVRWVPMAAADAKQLEGAFNTAVAQRCRPAPVVDLERITVQGGVVLVVNVLPSMALVGVKITGDKADGYGDPAWVFPLRVGSNADYLRPEMLPMYMVPDVRRKVLLLQQIPADSRVSVIFRIEDKAPVGPGFWQFVGVDERSNAIRLRPMNSTDDKVCPIDALKSAFCDAKGIWFLAFERFD